jgi:hypothetical protein
MLRRLVFPIADPSVAALRRLFGGIQRVAEEGAATQPPDVFDPPRAVPSIVD